MINVSAQIRMCFIMAEVWINKKKLCIIVFAAFALLLLSSFFLYANRYKIPVMPITSLLEEYTGNINSVDQWDHLNDGDWTYSIVPVRPGDMLSFKCYGTFFLAFLTNYGKVAEGANPDFCNAGVERIGRITYHSGVHKLIVPEGARFLYFSRMVDGSDSTPRYLYVDYVNILEGIFPDKPEDVFEDIPTDRQQVCVHHDSFCRVQSGKAWHIGSNGGIFFSMDYDSPRSDYQLVDDGFRIQGNKLINDPNISIKESFRLIKNKLGKESLVEIAIPKEPETYQRVIFNFRDTSNFESIQVYKSKLNSIVIEYITRSGKAERTRELFNNHLLGNAIRIFASNKEISIYCDETPLSSLSFTFIPSRQCGLMIDNQHKYQYDFFNCFQLQPYKIYDESRFTDYGIKQTHAGLEQGWVQDYSYTLDTVHAKKSHYAERFELRRNTITDYTNDRVEKSFNWQLQTNLRKIRIDFDVLVPMDYKEDESPDCIMQIHDRPDEDSMEGRSPFFAIRIKNNHFVYSAQSIEKKALSGYNINKILSISNCKLGEWTHFSIYIKEGYLPEHNPITRIYIDSKLVYESTDPNVNNNPRGGYVRYGIYKADWLKGIGDLSIQKKVLYFDNFMVRM